MTDTSKSKKILRENNVTMKDKDIIKDDNFRKGHQYQETKSPKNL